MFHPQNFEPGTFKTLQSAPTHIYYLMIKIQPEWAHSPQPYISSLMLLWQYLSVNACKQCGLFTVLHTKLK